MDLEDYGLVFEKGTDFGRFHDVVYPKSWAPNDRRLEGEPPPKKNESRHAVLISLFFFQRTKQANILDNPHLAILLVTFLGWLNDPFKGFL